MCRCVLQVRFKAAQAHPLTQQRLEDSRTIGHKDRSCQYSIHNLVSATRSRFETQQVATVFDPLPLLESPFRLPGFFRIERTGGSLESPK